MKTSAKLLLIGMVAAASVFSWQRNRHLNARPASALNSIPVGATISSPRFRDASPATALQSARLQKFSGSLAHTKAFLRSKLRQLAESETHAPDDEEGRAQLLQEMLAMLTDENVAEIIQSLSAAERNTAFGISALHQWMQTDPVTASNWLAVQPDTTAEQTFAVAEEWNHHPEALQQYLDKLPDTAWKQDLLREAGSDLSSKDPLAAIKLAGQMKPGESQTNLLRAVACSWVSSDPEAALEWATGVKDPALREQVMVSAIQAYALTDPAQAAAWLVSEIKTDETLKNATLNILETWVALDSAAAANWASLFPDSDFKSAAVKIVSQHWRQTDPLAAHAWIQKLSGAREIQLN